MLIQCISIYGAGSWGTALALQLARNGIDVLLWDINAEHIKTLQQDHQNQAYLANIPFPRNLHCTSDIKQLSQHSKHQLIVVPSHGFRTLLQNIRDYLDNNHTLLWATKGIELSSGKFLHQIVQEEIPLALSYGVISGPTFAAEVAKGLPTAMTVASSDEHFAENVAQAFKSDSFRMYTSNDILGVELGGAIKNVLAIAAGISDGLGYGANARAALITRGLAEIMRLGRSLGAKSETLMGLAGLGDLVLTCTDNQSRNRRLGLALGQGIDAKTAMQQIGQAVEGYKSAQSVCLLAKQAHVEMPIATQIHRILYENLSAECAVRILLSRNIKAE